MGNDKMNNELKQEFNRISKQISGVFMILIVFIIIIAVKLFDIKFSIILNILLYGILFLGCYSFFMNTTTIEQTSENIEKRWNKTGRNIKDGKTDKRAD